MTKQATQEVINDIFDEIGASELPPYQIWAGRYPVIQWNNKARSWEFPLESWGGSLIEMNNPLIQIDHGDDLPGFLLESISIAPIAERQIWEYKNEDGRMVRAEAPNMGDGNKWSKRYNILALLKQSGDLEPVIITAGGYTGEQLYNTIRQGRKRLATVLRTIDRTNIPAYLFWIELVEGKKQMVGKKDKKSAIWPPTVIVPELASLSLDELAAWMTEIYIGHPAKDALRDGLHEAGQQWKIERHAEVQMLTAGDAGRSRSIELNEDGTLYIPDLGDGTKDEWLKTTLDIGLFDARDKAHKAFLSVIRKKGLKGPTSPAQWDAWKEEIEHLWDEKLSKEQDEAREAELR